MKASLSTHFLVLIMNMNYSCTVVFNFQCVIIKAAFVFINLQFTMHNSDDANGKIFSICLLFSHDSLKSVSGMQFTIS